MNISKFLQSLTLSVLLLAGCKETQVTQIPLPEHPRPDFQREGFINLNGYWQFTFDANLSQGDIAAFDKQILVPFPWGSKLSEVADEGDIAWYGREITVPEEWNGQRVFLVVGASDWETTAWIDGQELGSHQGGYTPFEFELTDNISFGKSQTVLMKVDDTKADWHLYGKQGYGNARGLWQTVYLEARGPQYISSLHFTPDIDNSTVRVDAKLDSNPPEGYVFNIEFKDGGTYGVSAAKEISFDIKIENQHLWTLDDPFLYELTACLKSGDKVLDAVDSYFGQRKVSAVTVPGQNYKYVALNNEPLYLQLCLDQSYHPDGFYTFPSDEFMKNEILLSKKLGLNGNRVHIKVEVPRKLYWADKLGLLIMADVPNFWGEPIPEARQEWENCMRAQVERDYNHPSIFAWVDFNETWGLFTDRKYLPETQEWVRDMYHLTKSLDSSRLVEDNSACNNDHVETDINSWHSYEAWHNWEKVAAQYDKETVVGGSFNYIADNKIGDVPMINSECGDVWGYNDSAGDCDFTWDYHEMMNSFHRHPKIGGWLYTEHHDVINEWNGYVKFDRSIKIDGLDEIVPGMTIKDFHSPYYIVPMGEFHSDVAAGSTASVTLCSSFTTSKDPGALTLNLKLTGVDDLGRTGEYGSASMPVTFKPFELAVIDDYKFEVPKENGVYVLQMVLTDASGNVLHRNFNAYFVSDGQGVPNSVSFKPADYSACEWSVKNLDVMDGLKVNGFGSGWFEYQVDVPAGAGANGAELLFEASAKKLFGKDVEGGEIQGSFMLGGGTFDPCKSHNAYAMTDEILWPSKVSVSVNGVDCGSFELADDPADHRGLLSWHSQPRERNMYEGGSYGYLVKASIPANAIKPGEKMTVRFNVPAEASSENGGGLAIYGREFGRYPLDPTILFK